MKWRIDTNHRGAYALIPADNKPSKGWTTIDRFEGSEKEAQRYKIDMYGSTFGRVRPL